jgi:hypothetical protein
MTTVRKQFNHFALAVTSSERPDNGYLSGPKGNTTLPNASLRHPSFVCRHDAISLVNKGAKKVCCQGDGDQGEVTASLFSCSEEGEGGRDPLHSDFLVIINSKVKDWPLTKSATDPY